MLQMGCPGVSAGVAEHSQYTQDPWSRVRHTTDFYLRLVHAKSGDIPELRRYLKSSHSQVRGVDRSGKAYDAEMPDLQLWVHATVADSVLWSYQAVKGRMSADQLTRFWLEQRILALAIGIDASVVPASREGWERYLAEGKASLSSSSALLSVWELICRMPERGPRRAPFWAWRLVRGRVARVAALATRVSLPPVLAFEMGVSVPSEDRAYFRRVCLLMRIALPLMPPEIRFSARARKAQRVNLIA